MENEIQRINKVLVYLKISKNKLGISIGDKNGMRFQNVLSGRNGISEKLAKDITDNYPQISYEWLLNGKGSMLSNDNLITTEELNDDECKSSIKILREKAKISQQQLADATGIPKGRINGWEQRGSSPKLNDYVKIQEYFENNFPQLVESPKVEYQVKRSIDTEQLGVPVYDVEFSCGTMRSIMEARENHYPIAWLNIPDVKGCDLVIRARGDSMEDRISAKDWIGIRQIKYFKTDGFFSGLIYAIVTREQEVIKYLYKVRDDSSKVRIVSHNKHYEDDVIPINSIMELWEVKAVIPVSKIEIF